MIPGLLWYIIRSRQLIVEKFLFDASHEAKNRNLIQTIISHAIKGDNYGNSN